MIVGGSSTYVCVITGASRGIGRSTAAVLAAEGATVVTLGRDPALNTVVCDLASFASIRRAASEVVTRWPQIDLLIHNAGVHHARRRVTADGIERTLAVNHLAPFLLTQLLLPNLHAAADSRVLTVSSSLARWGRIHFDDIQLTRRYTGTRAYLQSKLANVMWTLSLAERWRGSGMTAACVYPGLVATDLLSEYWWWRARWLRPVWRALFLSAGDAGRAVARAARAVPPRENACFAVNGRLAPVPRRARDAAARRRLWEASAALVSA